MAVTIYTPETRKELSQRRLETYDRYNRVIQWGRKYPVSFCRNIMGIELLDIQKYCIEESWFAEFIIWLLCRNGSKSTMGAIYAMLRSLLLPFHTTYFISNVGSQAKETFLKLEHIAKRELESFVGSTDVFMNEVESAGPQGNGFVHDPASFHVQLFNGSQIFTLNSDPTNVKGRRANLLYVDEAGWVTDELLIQVEQFANQNADFKLGGGINPELEPKNFPRQLMYASSASDTDSAYYRKFREFSRQMMMGNSKYFACDFDIDAILAATVNGKILSVPLISRDKVDAAMSDNPEKGARELYNKFSSEAHEGQILTRYDLMQHTTQTLPVLKNETGNQLFMFSWDSARLNDNSVIEVAELINDPVIGWKMRLVNVNSLVDVNTKHKTPMRLPQQVDEFKKMLLDYNGTEHGKLDYENIKYVICDAGAGGQMIGGVSDYMLEDWTDHKGKKHKGIIDLNHKANETAKHAYPNAVDIMRLVDPKASRNYLFQAIEDMVKLGVVDFPTDYDIGKDYVVFVDEEGNETRHNLTIEQQISLANIDLLKTEIITMCKYTNLGNITYNFPPDKRNRMHDDRVFAFGLLCYQLAQLRRGQVVNKAPEKSAIEHRPLVSSVSMD